MNMQALPLENECMASGKWTPTNIFLWKIFSGVCLPIAIESPFSTENIFTLKN